MIFSFCVNTDSALKHMTLCIDRETYVCVSVCCQVGRQPVAGVFARLQVLPVLQERFPIQRARMRLKLQVGGGTGYSHKQPLLVRHGRRGHG
jgi:hypothetical protein